MPTGLTRILVINPQLEQALSVKRVLEPLGKYDVRPFTSLENALAFIAADAPPDLVVLDVELRGYKVGEVMALLRRRRAALPIILTGTSDADAQQMGAQAGLPVVRGRDLLPLIQRLSPSRRDESAAQPMAAPDEPPRRATQPDRSQLKTLPSPPELFPKLAAEEPPAPTLAEGGTVRDLIPESARETSTPDGVIEIQLEATVPDGPTSPLNLPTDDGQTDVPAPSVPQQILEGAQAPDQTPDTLVEQFAPHTTFDENDADLDSEPEEVVVAIAVEQPPVSPVVEEVPPPAPAPRQLGRRKTPKVEGSHSAPTAATAIQRTAAQEVIEEAARKALQLTQAATESTAAACILTRGVELIAHAGELPDEEVAELRGLLKDDWQPVGKGSRIRFVTLPSTGQDYMLIARRTEDDYTLTLAFLGDSPLSDIRRQSEALVQALARVPDPAPIPIPTLPMTAIWALSAPDQPLTAEAAQAIVSALDTNLKGDGWRIHNLNVHAEYIYVYCDTPADSLPGEVVSQLRNLTEQAVFARMPERSGTPLWSDSYLALVPGREMGADEVRRFLRFSRMSPHRKQEQP